MSVSLEFSPGLRSTPPAHERITPLCMEGKGNPQHHTLGQTDFKSSISSLLASPEAGQKDYKWRSLGSWQLVINVNRLSSAQNVIMWQRGGWCNILLDLEVLYKP